MASRYFMNVDSGAQQALLMGKTVSHLPTPWRPNQLYFQKLDPFSELLGQRPANGSVASRNSGTATNESTASLQSCQVEYRYTSQRWPPAAKSEGSLKWQGVLRA